MEVFLLQLFIFLTAASIAVPIAKRLGLGSVLGYLIAGIVIGPFGLSLIADVESVMHFTEFGVVMMLFLVGLELKPSLLLQMRVPIVGMGGTQVIVSSVVIMIICVFFLPWRSALTIGLILSLSSTAIVLQTLREKGLMNTNPGRSIFSVLLFQDLAVIPMLALLPLLVSGEAHGISHAETGLADISVLPQYQQVILTFAAIIMVFVIGRFVARPMFRIVARIHVREIFVGAALALVVGISLLMSVVGLSPALGAFLAGVVLADSEYRHELESDIEPFKGLLLGIFFISIGASLDFDLIVENLLLITGITASLMLIKYLILLATGSVFSMNRKDKQFFAVSLAQGGEFAFVLFSFAGTNGILGQDIIDIFVAAVAISMFLTPLVFRIYESISAKNESEKFVTEKSDVIEREGHRVILAGFGRLGTDLGRFLLSSGVKPVILDHDAANVEVLRKFGFEVYYGDVTRIDLLEAAGIREADILIIAIRDLDISRSLIELVQKHYPETEIVVNAADRDDVYQLMDLGIEHIRRETFGSALELGQDTLQILGYEPYEAYRMSRIFRKLDEKNIPELYRKSKMDEESYISSYRHSMKNLEELMNMDTVMADDEVDKAWSAVNPEN